MSQEIKSLPLRDKQKLMYYITKQHAKYLNFPSPNELTSYLKQLTPFIEGTPPVRGEDKYELPDGKKLTPRDLRILIASTIEWSKVTLEGGREMIAKIYRALDVNTFRREAFITAIDQVKDTDDLVSF